MGNGNLRHEEKMAQSAEKTKRSRMEMGKGKKEGANRGQRSKEKNWKKRTKRRELKTPDLHREDRLPTQMDETLNEYRVIQTENIEERPEVIRKELIFIGKKWEDACQEKLEEKVNLE
jgi:hypothetical protein